MRTEARSPNAAANGDRRWGRLRRYRNGYRRPDSTLRRHARIISYHNFDETPDNLEEIHNGSRDWIRTLSKSPRWPTIRSTTFRHCGYVVIPEIPTIAFCMGEMGLPSRILCGRVGAPMTYATFSEDRKMAPGQLTYQQMMDDFTYEEINRDTVILGVIADPVAHSLSPASP